MPVLHSNIIGFGTDHLVILHGFLGMGDNWKTHAKNLAEEGYCVHLVDQRNHGRSFWNDNFDYDIMIEDLLNYLDHHNLHEVILLGHSMGGKTAMGFALNYADRIKKLIVVDIAPKYYAHHHQQILTGLITLNFEQIASRKAAANHLEQFVADMGTRQFLLKNLYWVTDGQLGLRPNIAILKNATEAIGAVIASENQFTKPSLFLFGEKSNYINPKNDTTMILDSFPIAELTEIKNAGHWVHAEQPQYFFETLMQWLA
jgi:pimeloyl-ACP methyl ester carboxylesterase